MRRLILLSVQNESSQPGDGKLSLFTLTNINIKKITKCLCHGEKKLRQNSKLIDN